MTTTPETTDRNRAKEFGKAVATDVATTAAEVLASYAVLLSIGFAYKKFQDRKAKKSQKEN